jgi:hypothetical protein
MELLEFTEIVGERIQEWIEISLTFKNGCKREWHEDDSFEKDEVGWMFTQKGQRLYSSYVSKAQKIIEKKYPNEEYEDLERHTGVIYA